MKYSEIQEEITVIERNLKSHLEIVKELNRQKENVLHYHDLVILDRDSKEEIRVLDDADKKVICKQIDKEINNYTNQIRNLSIQIETLKNQQSKIY